MQYGSFYGGRRGASFVIAKSYLDIPSMVNDFKKGGLFTQVGYDEYVLINTVNKNHPDNGKIFKRGYDYNGSRTIVAYRAYENYDSSTETYFDQIVNGTREQYRDAHYEIDENYFSGGAIYIGTIVGPAGKGSFIEMSSYEEVSQKHADQGFQQQRSTGNYTLNNEDLIPGKYVEDDVIQYNDEIKWYCVSVLDKYNDTSTAYIGLKIPYPVIDFISTSVEPYDLNGDYADTSQAIRIDDLTHPFYEKWNLNIPKGIKGDTLNNFRIIQLNNQTYIDVYDINSQSPKYSQSEIENFNNNNFPKILVYDKYWYDNNQNGEKRTYFLGIFNQIKPNGISINENGTIVIQYTDGNTVTYPQLIKWVQNVSLNPDTGIFKVQYNTMESEEHQYYQSNLSWLKEIILDENGKISFRYPNPNYIPYEGDPAEDTREENQINNFIERFPELSLKIIKDIHFGSNQEDVKDGDTGLSKGTMVIVYNTLSSTETKIVSIEDQLVSVPKNQKTFFNLKWVQDIVLDEYGRLKLLLSDTITPVGNVYPENIDLEQYTLSEKSAPIKWINNIETSNDGTITIEYNTLNQQGTEHQKTIFENAIKRLQNVSFGDNGNIIFTYNNGEPSSYDVGIKWVKKIELDKNKDGQFLVEYTQGEPYSTYLKWPTDIQINSNTSQIEIVYSTVQKNNQGQPIVELGQNVYESKALPINYILKTKITEGDHHLIVLYSDSNKRQQIKENNQDYRVNGQSQTIDGFDGWLDLGCIYYDNGILVGLNVTSEDLEPGKDITDTNDVIEYLNTQYPTGLTGSFLDQKIVTAGDANSKKSFYAFDYGITENNYNGWYYLGEIAGGLSCSIISENQIATVGDFQTGGVLFIIEDD